MKFPIAVMLALVGVLQVAAQTAATGSSSSGQKSTVPRIVLPPDKPDTPSREKAAKDAKNAKAAEAAKAAKKATTKKEDEIGTIPGITIPRGEGFLGIQIVDSTFKLSFYDAKKKPVAVDVDRAALRWDPKYKVGEERVVLTPGGDGKSLTSPKNIRPPYHFKLFITLIREAAAGQSPVNETITVDFRQ